MLQSSAPADRLSGKRGRRAGSPRAYPGAGLGAAADLLERWSLEGETRSMRALRGVGTLTAVRALAEPMPNTYLALIEKRLKNY